MSIAQRVTSRIGCEAARRLIADFGGTRIYIPNRARHLSILTRSIGIEAAEELARRFGGERFLVPTKGVGVRPDRIVALRRRGVSCASIAREVGCTERRVFQVLAQNLDWERSRRKLRMAAKSGSERRMRAAVRAYKAAARAREAALRARIAAKRAYLAAARARAAAIRARLAATLVASAHALAAGKTADPRGKTKRAPAAARLPLRRQARRLRNRSQRNGRVR